MHYVKANGAEIPAIGMGTWTLEGEHCSEMVSRALQVGYRHIDTAAKYGNEAAVGQGLRASGVSLDEIFVTTKVWWTDIAQGDLQRSAEASLKRLDLGQVDLLLIHWPNQNIPLDQSIEALNDVKRHGMARHIGVSNFPTALLQEAVGLSPEPLVCNQVESHPYLDQDRVLEFVRGNGMALTAYCPLYRGGELFEEAAVLDAARAHGKSPAQVVLRWHVQQDQVIAIPRTSRAERLKENLSIFDFQLAGPEMKAISALRSRHERICDFDFSPAWDPS